MRNRSSSRPGSENDQGQSANTLAVKRAPFFRRPKGCPLSDKEAPPIDYKNVKLLTRFISERGRILPSRITSVSAKKQRALTTAIKRARFLALLPFKGQ